MNRYIILSAAAALLATACGKKEEDKKADAMRMAGSAWRERPSTYGRNLVFQEKKDQGLYFLPAVPLAVCTAKIERYQAEKVAWRYRSAVLQIFFWSFRIKMPITLIW